MTSSANSNSDNPDQATDSRAFLLLHEKVQRWIWQQGWDELRDAQEEAIEPILGGQTDVIISAATASGKTEAAFLPICSSLIDSTDESVQALYISPLKALINDQHDRLSGFCEHLEIPVSAWHGDIAQSRKEKVIKNPSGILLITPESLEALFVNRGPTIQTVFKGLKYVVVDELHSFIGMERGRQLQSLLARLELCTRRHIPRIALSATLGDMKLAADFLRSPGEFPCKLISSTRNRQEVQLQVRGYRVERPVISVVHDDELTGHEEDIPEDGSTIEIAHHLFRTLRGQTNLAFANRRADVEVYADLLRRLCEDSAVPNEFWPHHGSLSKDLREDVERMLKERTQPTTAVCTTTLEMGIDIGSVNSIAQIGPPPTVASLRQRLGRSGRRGQPAIVRVYIQEDEIDQHTPPEDSLRTDLVQAIAMVNLLIRGWCEPPITGRLHLSTLVQQVLSLIAQYGGINASNAWRVLCERGPFKDVSQQMFSEFLRSLGKSDLISQAGDGTLILGMSGERMVNHYSFYAAFSTAEEYIIVHGSKRLGSLPVNYPLFDGAYLIFAGKRWQVISVDEERRLVEVKPSRGGRPPKFSGSIGLMHDAVVQEMKAVYLGAGMPIFLNTTGRELLREGRDNFRRFELDKRWLLPLGNDILIFLWKGSLVMNTVAALLLSGGFKVSQEGVALHVSDASEGDIRASLESKVAVEPPSPVELAGYVANKITEKHDRFLSEELLKAEYGTRYFDIHNTWRVLADHTH